MHQLQMSGRGGTIRHVLGNMDFLVLFQTGGSFLYRYCNNQQHYFFRDETLETPAIVHLSADIRKITRVFINGFERSQLACV